MVKVDQARQNWKTKVNIYHLIQQQCDRPAYLWNCYRYIIIDSLPTEKGVLTIDDMIDAGKGDVVIHDLMSGIMDPRAWCDTN